MVTYPTNRSISRLIDTATPGAKAIDAEWFSEAITIELSNSNTLTTIVFDFAYSLASIIEYTLDDGLNWIEFNNGTAVQGGQSRYLRVTTGVEINLRAKTAATLRRAIAGEV